MTGISMTRTIKDQEHDDNETSDDNSVTHVEVDDANENARETD